MSYIVYDRIKGTSKGAHQYVVIDGIRIGEIWRQQVSQATSNGKYVLKWRWFAQSYRTGDQTSKSCAVSPEGYGTKDKAVDALENVV